MSTIVERAPAKVNLLLGVKPGLVDGKHELVSVFATLALADVLTFVWDEGAATGLTTTYAPGIEALDIDAAPENNIVMRTLRAMEAAFGREAGAVGITLEKHIPAQAGLGGGSSDAAATIRALARHWGEGVLDARCLAVAREMGADVAFFLYGGCALMTSYGDVLERRLPLPSLDVVLVKPQAGVSTAAAYAAFDAGPPPMPDVAPLLQALEDADVDAIAAAMANNLAAAAEGVCAEIPVLVRDLERHDGVVHALLSGSGSTVFAICGSAAAAQDVAAAFAARGYWTCATMTGSTEGNRL
jgi:4-diphosphocytidyl-2-C-methyl-D-erythritol kinase